MLSETQVMKLVLELDGKRLVFAAPVPIGIDPMEMTLGEWRKYHALSAVAIADDFFGRAALGARHD